MKKIGVFFGLIVFVFGYAVYDAIKVDKMLTTKTLTNTGSVITSIPEVSFFKYPPDLDKKILLSNLSKEGNNIIVHFWATWCAPCEKEFPDLMEAVKILEEKENLKFVLVAVRDDQKKIKRFLKKYNVDSKNIVLLEDRNSDHKLFGTYKLPESYLFSSNGNLLKKYPGVQSWTQKHIISFLKSL